MNGKSLVMLVLAVVSGLGAMVGTSRMLQDRKKPEARMRDVLVAARDLKVEEVLKPDLVRVQQMPEATSPPARSPHTRTSRTAGSRSPPWKGNRSWIAGSPRRGARRAWSPASRRG